MTLLKVSVTNNKDKPVKVGNSELSFVEVNQLVYDLQRASSKARDNELFVKIRAREEVLKVAVKALKCFKLSDSYLIGCDSVHLDLIERSESSFNEFLSLLDGNSFLRSITIKTGSTRDICVTKDKKRIFRLGSVFSGVITKAKAKELLVTAKPVH
jgi:hypothetical protein